MEQFVFRGYFYSDPADPTLRVVWSERSFAAENGVAAVSFARSAFDEDICMCDHVAIFNSEERSIWEDGLKLPNGEFGSPERS